MIGENVGDNFYPIEKVPRFSFFYRTASADSSHIISFVRDF